MGFYCDFRNVHTKSAIKVQTFEGEGGGGPIHSIKQVVWRTPVRQTAARAQVFAQKAENLEPGGGTRYKPWKT